MTDHMTDDCINAAFDLWYSKETGVTVEKALRWRVWDLPFARRTFTAGVRFSEQRANNDRT